MSYDVPTIHGQVITLTIEDPNAAADADINFSTYMPKINLEYAEPVIRIVLHDTTDGGATTEIEYTINDRVALAASLATGKFFITDEDTINIGDGTNTGAHTYRLEITYIAGRIQNT